MSNVIPYQKALFASQELEDRIASQEETIAELKEMVSRLLEKGSSKKQPKERTTTNERAYDGKYATAIKNGKPELPWRVTARYDSPNGKKAQREVNFLEKKDAVRVAKMIEIIITEIKGDPND